MKLDVFRLEQKEVWGDYGDVLLSGYSRFDSSTKELLLHRGGPFTPPIFFPWGSDCGLRCVVTESFRQPLFVRFPDIEFRLARKDRIVRLGFQWEHWSRKKPPRIRPEDGEPENYIWDAPHSPDTASAMDNFWEVLPPVVPCKIRREQGSGPDDDYFIAERPAHTANGLFRDREDWFHLLVDRSARAWLTKHAFDWVDFGPLSVQHSLD